MFLELKSSPPIHNFDSDDKSIMGLVQKAVDEVNHPFYFYDIDAFEKHFSYLVEHTNKIGKLWYACKANPISRVLQTVDKTGGHFDIASPGELAQVLRQGVSPDKILATGPAKSKSLLRRYIEAGLRIFVCESHNQVIWLNELSKEYDIRPTVLLRLQIHWDEGESSVLGGDSITPFGLEASEWLKLSKDHFSHLNLKGIHSFQWGNILCEKRMIEIWQAVLSKASEMATLLNFNLEIVDLGGGIGIPYRDQSSKINWALLMTELEKLKLDHNVPEIWLELGRYAIGEFGGYVTKVIDKKNVRGKNILVLDSGMNQLARPMLTKQGFPIQALKEEGDFHEYQIHGPLCTALDHLGDYALPKNLEIDDWLLFKKCGAYGFTESMPYFLCHSLPGEAVISGGKLEMLRVPRPASHYLV